MNGTSNNLWGVILAGGEGIRLQNLVQQIYGYKRPKQYCTFTGTRSLLKHTIDRVSFIIPPRKIKIVVNKEHSEYSHNEVAENILIELIEQPIPKETSAGILLPMLKIFHEDLDSTVALFPSDHFILGERQFMEYVKKAAAFVADNPEMIVMLGVHANKSESGYGWIEPEQNIADYSGAKFFRVKRFWEKPNVNVTKYLTDKGCLINTFVLVGKSKTFLYYMNRNIPDLVKAFTPIRTKIGTPIERIMINRTYKYLPSYNFSKAVLENICRALVVMEVKDVYWSDWGEEHRVCEDIESRLLPLRDNVISPQISLSYQ